MSAWKPEGDPMDNPDGEDGTFVEEADGSDPLIRLYNEGRYNSTAIRVSAVLAWLRNRRPDLL